LRMKGSDGGHNGLKSINAVLGRTDYPRLRIGIGNDFEKGARVSYVLGEWDPDQEKQLPDRLQVAADTCLSFVSVGGPTTMTAFNNK
jgi:PTH1 family peptidyl-tRNA hydrolase